MKKEEKWEKSTAQINPQVEPMEGLLKEPSMFNDNFNDYTRFTFIPKGNLPPKITTLNIKFHGTENTHSSKEFSQCTDTKRN